ncbi:class A beta-lactamase [Pontixanthobacter sp.]|uniref:class A beta-lactamase n=1 Tax=Pontixanthobacter sp. TaxID=2792078 RepID=UPI003C7E897D
MMPDRRQFLAGSSAVLASACVPLDTSATGRITSRLRIIEASAQGTLGAAILNTATGAITTYNGAMRFGHCSSFKLSLAAMVLQLDAAGTIDADEQIRWSADDLMFVSPFTTRRLEQGASLRELAEYTQKYSDNAAANILLKRLGGPARLTRFWRALGDQTSRLDRMEPELGNVPPGEMRDTTTPRAMAQTLATVLYGDALPENSRSILKQWMVDTPTGLDRVRKGLPDTWRAGDKTGTSIWPGMGSLYVDIGFAEPPSHAPLTFAAYYRARGTHAAMDPASLDVLAQVGRVIQSIAR